MIFIGGNCGELTLIFSSFIYETAVDLVDVFRTYNMSYTISNKTLFAQINLKDLGNFYFFYSSLQNFLCT
jgi:hypothetical protein